MKTIRHEKFIDKSHQTIRLDEYPHCILMLLKWNI